MRWITDDIVALLSPIQEIDRIERTDFPGGDFDTRGIIAWVGDERLFISGFNTQDTIGDKDWDNAEIEFIEIKDGQDSRGGCNSSDEDMCVAYAKVCARLRQQGHLIVNTYEEYF